MIKAASAYIEKNNEVLTIERESGKYKGYRAMPHGIVEKGETPEITAIRETQEETGYNVKVLKKLADYKGKFGTRHGKFSNKPVHIYIFESEIIGGELKPCMNPQWIPKRELLKRKDVVPSLETAIKSAKK